MSWHQFFHKALMEFLETHDLIQWQLWTPLMGGVFLWIGLNIRIVQGEDDQ